jgi:hypothetical protein
MGVKKAGSSASPTTGTIVGLVLSGLSGPDYAITASESASIRPGLVTIAGTGFSTPQRRQVVWPACPQLAAWRVVTRQVMQ